MVVIDTEITQLAHLGSKNVAKKISTIYIITNISKGITRNECQRGKDSYGPYKYLKAMQKIGSFSVKCHWNIAREHLIPQSNCFTFSPQNVAKMCSSKFIKI